MKKLIIASIVFFLLCCLVAVGLFYGLYKYYQYTKFPLSLIKENGNVFYKKNEDENFSQMMTKKLNLNSNATVKTSNGEVFLVINKQVGLFLLEETEVKIIETERKYYIDIQKGKMLVVIKSKIKKDNFKFIAGSRLFLTDSSSFIITKEDGDNSKTYVITKILEAYEKNEASADVISNKKLVSFDSTYEFQKSNVMKNDPLIYKTTDADKKSDWFKKLIGKYELFEEKGFQAFDK